MNEPEETKRWVSVVRTDKKTNVTVTIQQGKHTVKWCVPTFSNHIEEAVIEADAGARRGLDNVVSALKRLEDQP